VSLKLSESDVLKAVDVVLVVSVVLELVEDAPEWRMCLTVPIELNQPKEEEGSFDLSRGTGPRSGIAKSKRS
jgi:hypothetical protein